MASDYVDGLKPALLLIHFREAHSCFGSSYTLTKHQAKMKIVIQKAGWQALEGAGIIAYQRRRTMIRRIRASWCDGINFKIPWY